MDCREIQLGFAYVKDAQPIALMSRDLIEAGLPWSYRRDRVAALITDPDTVALVARRGRERLGFAIMAVADQRAHLTLMAVYPSCQRRGIGQRMVEWLLESCMVAGIACIDLELRAGNRAAFRLYRKLGFDEISRVAGYYSGRETAIRMVRVLRTSGVVAQPWRPPTLDRH